MFKIYSFYFIQKRLKKIEVNSSICLSVTVKPGGYFSLRSGGFEQQVRLAWTELRLKNVLNIFLYGRFYLIIKWFRLRENCSSEK